MFINRPLIHGTANNNMTTRRSKSTKDDKSCIRVKTLPSQSGKKTLKGSKNDSIRNDGSSMIDQNNLIGIKDVKQMIDMDIQSLLQRVIQFQTFITDEQLNLIKKQKKLQSKSTTTNNTISYTGTNNKASSSSSNIQLQQQNEFNLQQQQQQQRAYNECREILQMRNQQQQRMYNKINQSIRIKMFQLQQRKLQLNEVNKSTQNEIQKLKGEILKRQHDIKLYRKKSTIKQNIKQQIQQQLQNISKMNQQLFSHKQQSLKQKNNFIEIQAQEIKIIKQIQKYQQQQQKHSQINQQFQYYKKIQKLKNKLIKSKEKQQNEVDMFFQQKINDVIKLRIGNDQIQVKTTQLQVKIQQQLAIISMLEKRNLQLQKQQQQEGQGDNLSKIYRQKYERLFMNKYNNSNNRMQYRKQQQNSNNLLRNRLKNMNVGNNSHFEQNDINDENEDNYRELNHWQNYKSYLEKILVNEKRLNNNFNNSDNNINVDSQSFIISTKANSQVFVDGSYNDKRDYLRRQNENQSPLINRRKRETKIKSTNQPTRMDRQLENYKHKNHQSSSVSMKNSAVLLKSDSKSKKHKIFNKQYLAERQQQYVKPRQSLPRLVKMQGSIKDRDKIKNQLTKFTNQQFDSQIQLQTVRTSQADGDEQIIQVEFRGRRDSVVESKRKGVEK